jgi:YVTN family beta-propeller protein
MVKLIFNPKKNESNIIAESKSSKKIIISNGHDNSLSIIDPVEDKVLNTIAVGGVPEAAASDDSGKLFVNLEDKNEIVVVDTKTFKVINRYSLFPGEGPTGLVYDKKNRRLFSGCQGLLIIMNADNGKIIDKIKIGNGCDGVVFDESNQTIYTSNGEGNISVIKQENENVYYLLPQILTKKGARTIAIDKSTHLLYLPTAEFDPKEVNEKGRPKMKDGTFNQMTIIFNDQNLNTLYALDPNILLTLLHFKIVHLVKNRIILTYIQNSV